MTPSFFWGGFVLSDRPFNLNRIYTLFESETSTLEHFRRGRGGRPLFQVQGQGQQQGLIGSAIKKCTPDSREGSIFLIRPVVLRKFPDPGTAK